MVWSRCVCVCVVNSSRALECVRERRGEREQAGWQWMVLGQDQAIKRQASAGRLAKRLRIAQFRFHAFEPTPTS